MHITFSITTSSEPGSSTKTLPVSYDTAQSLIRALIEPQIRRSPNDGDLIYVEHEAIEGSVDPNVIVVSVLQNRILEHPDGSPYFTELENVPANLVANLFALALEASTSGYPITWS